MLTETATRPDECVLAFGIPTSREAFLRDRDRPDKDFAGRFAGLWRRYDDEVAGPLRAIEPELTGRGVSVEHETTLIRFGELLRDEKYRVIILFSHWHKNMVEFADAMTAADDIVAIVPEDFSGVLDLCVCHPEGLTKGIRAERPRCRMRFCQGTATPFFWLSFYQALFEHLDGANLPYLAALTQVASGLLGTLRGGKGE